MKIEPQDRITDEMCEHGKIMAENILACNPKLTIEALLRMLSEEYAYWRQDDSVVAIGAIGSLANIIARASTEKDDEKSTPVECEL